MRYVPVYLDHCTEGEELLADSIHNPELFARREPLSRDEAEALACGGCPVGGSSEPGVCAGVWRRSDDHSVYIRTNDDEEEPV